MKQELQRIGRRAGILEPLDKVRFAWIWWKDVVRGAKWNDRPSLPPFRLAYDAYGTLDRGTIVAGGKQTAAHFAATIRKYTSEPGRLLDWGCGPGRVVRYLPEQLPGWQFYGSDYNAQSIEWCRDHLPGIEFASNGLDPPLKFPSGWFSAVYSMSVFTHLSEMRQRIWVDELWRVLKYGGILLLTLHGDFVVPLVLSKAERVQYAAGSVVVRGGVPEGKRLFTAYHPPEYVRRVLLPRFQLLEHVAAPSEGLHQDLWIVRKV